MNETTEKWLDLTPVEALLCRDLRHAWPRPNQNPLPAARRKPAVPGVPPDTKWITWQLIAEQTPTHPRVLERTMICPACQGQTRIETFVVRHDRLVRTGVARYRPASWYKRSRAEDEDRLEPLDADVLRGSILTRLYPDLRW